MGIAVSGMHYTGMAAMHVHRGAMVMSGGGRPRRFAFLLPLLIGISVLTLVVTLTISMSPNGGGDPRGQRHAGADGATLQQRADSGEDRPPQDRRHSLVAQCAKDSRFFCRSGGIWV